MKIYLKGPLPNFILILIVFSAINVPFIIFYDSKDSRSINQSDKKQSESCKLTSESGSTAKKVYSETIRTNLNCYINQKQPSLNRQPQIYLPDTILSHAKMSFENLKAENYTKELEVLTTDFVNASIDSPTYIFQKFSVEGDQYVNNVSIYIQDNANRNIFNEDNSWEVAIFNCSNDFYGTPQALINSLMNPHPLLPAAHWELFDFEHSTTEPIGLNTSATNYTVVNGVREYWFAFRVKIPKDDSSSGGGHKYLYFNRNDKKYVEGIGNTFAFF